MINYTRFSVLFFSFFKISNYSCILYRFFLVIEVIESSMKFLQREVMNRRTPRRMKKEVKRELIKPNRTNFLFHFILSYSFVKERIILLYHRQNIYETNYDKKKET